MKKLLIVSLILFSACAAAAKKCVFHATITPVPLQIRKMMTGRTWNQDCPVDFDHLSYIRMTYWGFDNTCHTGEMVVNHRLAKETVSIFKDIYRAKFPIERMELASRFKTSADRGKADDTYAFNCRADEGAPGKLSLHSYGIAIDINQLYNPARVDGKADPAGSEKYFNRHLKQKGMIQINDAVFKTFTKHGWTWGGLWSEKIRDYQHFQRLISRYYEIDRMHYQYDKTLPN